MEEKDIDKLIKKLEGIIKELKSMKNALSESELKEMQVELDIPKEKSKTQLINEHFEKCWKALNNTPYDRKKSVTKETKVRLYDYSFEQITKAIEIYYDTTNPKYRFKKDRFLNEAIWSYLDDVEKGEDTKQTNFTFNKF